MALTSSTSVPLKCQIQIFREQRYRFCRSILLLNAHNRQFFQTHSIRMQTMLNFYEPRKIKTYVNHCTHTLWKTLPVPMKEFPWKKAEDISFQRLLVLGKKTLKWSLITLFFFSSLSDVILSISRNKELTIPLGLFVGCMMADFLKETSQELFRTTEEKRIWSWYLLGIGSFFLFLKLISVNFTIQGWLLLSHVGNGGLLQVLWLWKNLQEERNNSMSHKERSSLLDDVSMAKDN